MEGTTLSGGKLHRVESEESKPHRHFFWVESRGNKKLKTKKKIKKMSEHSFVSTMTVNSETVLDYASAYIEFELKSKQTSTKTNGLFR